MGTKRLIKTFQANDASGLLPSNAKSQAIVRTIMIAVATGNHPKNAPLASSDQKSETML
jgi:hypothetical protein